VVPRMSLSLLVARLLLLLLSVALGQLPVSPALPVCEAPLLRGVALAAHNLAAFPDHNVSACATRCCGLPACQAWTFVERPLGGSRIDVPATGCPDGGPCCYLKGAAQREPCPPRFNCTSWSRVPPSPTPPEPAPCGPPPPTAPCDRGWQRPVLNHSGCGCSELALVPGTGTVAYPKNASLTTDEWEDRAYPWGGDAVFHDGAVHGFFAEWENHCPMTYGTWYTSTHIRHAVADADADGRPKGAFVAQNIAIPRAAGNPVLLKQRTADGYWLLFFTNQRYDRPVRQCSGRDPALWHNEAVYEAGSPMGVNLAYARSLSGPWTTRYGLIQAHSTNPAVVALPNGTVLVAYKTWPSAAECTALIGRPSCKAVGLFSTGVEAWNGSYTHRPMGERFVAVATDIEDPSMYRDPASGTLHMVVHTEDGGGAGGSAHSTDLGKTWHFYQQQHAYEYDVGMEDGLSLHLTNREEPKLLLDKDGFPLSLINQAAVRALKGMDSPPPPGAGYSGPQGTHLTFTLMQQIEAKAVRED
jgi:hypothetical protein